eukprot:12274365-Ditylum_brightwellii.AAC.1
MVAMLMGQWCPDGACKGKQQLIVVLLLLFRGRSGLLWVALGDLGGSVCCVSDWTQLMTSNNNNNNNNNNNGNTY